MGQFSKKILRPGWPILARLEEATTILATQRQRWSRMTMRWGVLLWQDSLMEIDVVTMMRRSCIIIGKLGAENVG
jgi:hypothetical protein